MEREHIHSIHKIVICTLDSLYSGVSVHDLVEAFPERISLIIASKRYGKKYGSFFKQLTRNWKRSGFMFVEYLSFHFVYYYLVLYIVSFFNKLFNRKNKVYSVSQLAKKYNISVIRTNNPSSRDVIDRIKEVDPDLLVSVYFDHVIRQPIIDMPKFGVINVHTASLPDYRGPFPPLWPLIMKDKSLGVTVHYINSENLDTGPILAESHLPTIEGESVLGADCRLVKEGIKLVKEVIVKIENGTAHALSQEERGRGSYYPYPNKDDLKKLSIPLFTLKDFFSQFF